LQCSEGNVAVGFSGPRNYTGTLFTSGFSFIPTPKIVNALKQEIIVRAVAILDFKDWAAKTGATYGKGYEDTGYFNSTFQEKKRKCCGRFKLD
jgi:hypothetical protein